jgi:dTDP-glucose 4,6-dehydratase
MREGLAAASFWTLDPGIYEVHRLSHANYFDTRPGNRQDKNTMKILITGGCGFIGSQLTREFIKHGHDVVVIDALTYAGFYTNIVDTGATFYRGDLTHQGELRACFQMHGPFDVVIHAAAESSVDRSIRGYTDFIATNVMGSSNLFQLCREYKVPRVINFGTDEVYGHFEENQDGKFKEDDNLRPRNIYAATKASQVLMAKAFYTTHDVPIINVCPANCYGPRQHAEKLIPKTIYCLLNDIPLPLYNEGKNIREWLYVEDAAEAIVTLSGVGEPGETYNLGTIEERSVIDVINTISNIMAVPPIIDEQPARPGDDFRYGVQYDKMHALGWSPKTAFGDGIIETVRWYLEHPEFLETSARRLGLKK